MANILRLTAQQKTNRKAAFDKRQAAIPDAQKTARAAVKANRKTARDARLAARPVKVKPALGGPHG